MNYPNMTLRIKVFCFFAILIGMNIAAAKPQQVCLPETDADSPRHTMLKSQLPDDEIIRTDVNGDGKPDILECWWNSRRVRWIDENDDMKDDDIRGDLVNDSLQIDRDGDGFYDGPDDMTIKWVDRDNDGIADFVVFAINPNKNQSSLWAGASHYMAFEDIDGDNVMAAIDWETVNFEGWRFTGKGNFCPDYNGNSLFLKVHYPPFALQDPRYNWENPFLFYDFDRDGVTEMAIRIIDSPITIDESTVKFDGLSEECFVSFDLDNDTQKGNEMDYDFTLRFAGGKLLDYNKFVNKFPNLKAPDWVLPYYRYTNWREIDELIYIPHDKAYEEIFKTEWGSVWLTCDEDDDDHRWERVEVYFPDDPYVTNRWQQGKPRGMTGHPQADTLGDRGEFDQDNSGKGKLFVGSWDGKIHLYGAEWGAWLVDKDAEFWGSWPVTGDSSPKVAEKRDEVVQYYDIDANGFFDKITYDYDGDKEVDYAVSLLDFKTTQNPNPDVQVLFNPAEEKWHGMHQKFIELAEESWQEAWTLYRVIWKKGWSNRELDELMVASSTWEKYDHAYWFKERLVRMLREVVSSDTAHQIDRLYFTGDINGLAGYLENMGVEVMHNLNAKSEEDIYSEEYITNVEPAFWERGALYTGIVAAYRATGDDDYLNNALAWGEANKWQINPTHGGFLNADNQVALQSYCDLYMIKGGEEKIAAAKNALDKMVENPPVGRENWWWCDALYMSPPFMARMTNITGDKKYVELMNTMWWDTYDFLYDKEEDLFYRDKNFFDKKTKNGKKMFWSRGNGWVLAGITHVLDYLPEDDPKRDDFIEVFKKMSRSVAAKQGDDGLWRTSLLDYDEFPMPETSGSGFYCHAMAWGINRGILDKDEYLPVVKKAWEGLTRCVYPNGKLGWTQMVAGSPGSVSPQMTREYAVGAFLLSGSEMLKLGD